MSGFVAVAAQLILIKSRAILPRPPQVAAVPLDEEPDPEAELRARLIEYRRFRDAGAALGRLLGVHRLFRRDAEVAALAGRAGARPPQRPPLPTGCPGRGPGEAGGDRSASATRRRDRHPDGHPGRAGGGDPRGALPGGSVVLQELLGGVRDRVVVAVTFLALLELYKRREITLEQAEPWGPIVARRLTGAAPVEVEAEIDESLGAFA